MDTMYDDMDETEETMANKPFFTSELLSLLLQAVTVVITFIWKLIVHIKQ